MVALLSGMATAGYALVTERPDGNPAEVRIQIPSGATGERIVAVLERKGMAPHPRIMFWTLRFKGVFDRIQAGTYVLPGDANALEVARILNAAPATTFIELTLIPGQSMWQHARRFRKAGIGRAGELLELNADRVVVVERFPGLPVGPARAIRPDGVAHTYLEGFLYPDTYFLDPKTNTSRAVHVAVDRFQQVWGELKRRYRADLAVMRKRVGLSDHQLVTLASLVEKEMRLPREGPTIAGVFHNRLERRMRLQTDPTLTYHPSRVGSAPKAADKRNGENPYNTYRIKGLPPGPICSPGRVALESVLRPERHPYLYFVARRDSAGTHAFAATLEEHSANVRRFLKRSQK